MADCSSATTMSETVRYSLGDTRAALSSAKCDREASQALDEVTATRRTKGFEYPELVRLTGRKLQWYWEILNMEFLPANCHPGVLSIATPAEAFCERAVFFGIIILLSWALYALLRSAVTHAQNLLFP